MLQQQCELNDQLTFSASSYSTRIKAETIFMTTKTSEKFPFCFPCIMLGLLRFTYLGC